MLLAGALAKLGTGLREGRSAAAGARGAGRRAQRSVDRAAGPRLRRRDVARRRRARGSDFTATGVRPGGHEDRRRDHGCEVALVHDVALRDDDAY
jgi:hypothetical protein